MAIKLLFMNRNNVSITIFTPTYNRAHLLPRLYESLILLENCDFEWVIVDDGSIDSTEQVVNEFIKKAFFPIFYFKKENGSWVTKTITGKKIPLSWCFTPDEQVRLRSAKKMTFEHKK